MPAYSVRPRLDRICRHALVLACVAPAVAFGLTSSTVTLTSSPNPSAYGQLVTLDASVTAGATGKVTFYDGTTPIGVGSISGSHATLATVLLPSGARSLRAYYAGDSVYEPGSSSLVTHTVNPGASLGLKRYLDTTIPYFANSIAVSDFNHDGRQDLATASTSAFLAVSLGNGDGSFATAAQYTLQSMPLHVIAADLNGDGNADLAAALPYVSKVAVLLGSADGTFQAAVYYATGSSYSCQLAVGDFNADGKLDLVVANSSSALLSVLLGDGAGALSSPATYNIGTGQYSVVVTDLNADGNADIVAGAGGGLSILLGNGTGAFGTPSFLPTATSYVLSMVAGDFNGDGKPDLAIGAYYGIYIVIGNGDGSLGTVNSYSNSGRSIAAADFDGNGALDIAAPNPYTMTLQIYPGAGDGSLGAPTSYALSHYVSSDPVAVGDFNGDSKTDVVTAGYSSNLLTFLAGGAVPDLSVGVAHGGLTQGQVGAPYVITVSNAGEISTSGAIGVVITLPSGLTATSLDGAGWTCVLSTLACVRTDTRPVASQDVINMVVNVSGAVSGDVEATFTVSGGGDQNTSNNSVTDTAFIRTPTTTSLLSSPDPSSLGQTVTLTATVTAGATGTVNFYNDTTLIGSGALSGGTAVMTTSSLPPGTALLRAAYSGDGHYGPSASAYRPHAVTAVAANGATPAATYKVGSAPYSIASADVNHDGLADLVTADSNSYSGFSVFLANSDGGFRDPVSYRVASYSHYSSRVLVGDVNLDGNLDVATFGGLTVYLGKGDGTFGAGSTVSSLSSLYAPALADFNGDAKPDIVAASDGRVVLLLGNGDGTFQPPLAVTAISTYVNSLAVGDLNGDGRADVVTNNILILLGKGDGSFQSPIVVSTGSETPSYVMLGDFNGDRRLDVVYLTYGYAKTLLGNGDGSLKTAISSTSTNSPGAGVVGDFNGDGKLDIGYTGYSAIFFLFGNGEGTFPGSGAVSVGSSPNSIVLGDFNRDGRPDFATAFSSPSSVTIFSGGQFSGLSVSMTHIGNFTAGSSGAYRIAVQNPGYATATGQVSVTVTLPSGLTAASIADTYYQWTCVLSTLTCTRPEASYLTSSPTLYLTVNVSSALSASTVISSASVTNGGKTNSVSDATAIVLATATTLTSSPLPSTLGRTVTLTATVSAGATGLVVFSDGGAPIGYAALSGNQATLTTTFLESGPRGLAASYSGDSTHASSSSAVRTHAVRPSPASGFGAIVNYGTASVPLAIATGDFDGDGHLDLVTSNNNSNSISVLRGLGNGAFAVRSDYTVGPSPAAVAVGDFNGDHKRDLAVSTSDGLNLLLGNGDGAFQPAVNYSLGSAAGQLGVADFNSDGMADLVVGGSAPSVFFGSAAGSLRPGEPLPFYSGSVVQICDCNLDGRADILYSNGWSFYLMVGNGDGTFHPPSYTGFAGYTLTMGDLNGDGAADAVTTDGSGVLVALGKPDGTFQSSARYGGNVYAASSVCADVNGDGRLDVIAVGYGSNAIGVFYGVGDGALQTPITYTVGTTPKLAVAADFNGDARADLAVANSQSNNVSVLLGILTPVLTINLSHSGAFGLGQTGAIYEALVANAGPGVTSGTVTVTVTIPAGLAATAIAGSGWSCTLASLTCTRTDSIGSGSAYPVLTVTVNVTASSQGTVIAQAAASGGGAVGASAADTTALVDKSIAPQPVSVAPSSGESLAASLQLLFSHQNGYSSIGYVEIIVNSSLRASGACYLRYERAANRFWLLNDGGTSFSDPVAPGASASLSNSQCSLNMASASAAGSGNNLSLTVPVTFTTAFAGTKNIYVWGASIYGVGSSYQALGTWTVPGAAAMGLSVSPASGSGSTANLQFVASHSAGFANLGYLEAVINGSLAAPNSCYLRYERVQNRLFLLNDAGNSFGAPMTPGSAGTLSNSQCSVNVAQVTAVGSGNNLTLSAPVDFSGSFAGSKDIYLWTATLGGQTAGYSAVGSWTVPSGAQVLSLVSVSPASGTGSAANLQFVASYTGGYSFISHVEAVINGGLAAANGCYLRYERAANRLYLLNDAGTSFGSSMSLGVAGTLSNSQCSVNVGGASAVGSGTTLTLTVPVTFASAFAGNRNIYTWVAAAGLGLTTSYQLSGAWTVPGSAAAPTAVSVTPASGSAGSDNFQFVVSHGAGFANISYVEVVIHSTLAAAQGCYLRYERAANRLYLLNDAGSSFGAPLTPGVAGALSNSQCSVNIGAAGAIGSGNNLTVTAPITFASAFAGSRKIYLWAASNTGQQTAYTQVGSWTVPGSSQSPVAVSVSPSSGTSTSAAFQFVVSHPAGYANLAYLEVVVNGSLAAADGCYLRYERAANRLYLLNDAGNSFGSPATPGSALTLSNSQCSVNVAATSVGVSGNTMTLTAPVVFSDSFHGSKNIYLWAASVGGQTSGYQALGTRTLP